MKDSTTIIKLLHDMRTVINNINSNNNNIYSFEFKKCEIHCNWKNNNHKNKNINHQKQQQQHQVKQPLGQQQENHYRVLIQDGWIDVCKESLCINLTVEEKLLRITYKDIYGLNFCADLNTAEVSSLYDMLALLISCY